MASPAATDVYGTSAWQIGNAGLVPKFSSILQKYGIVPDAATLGKYGLSSLFDANGAAGAQTNPNSVYAQLGRARDIGYETNMHTAQGHNALSSGAFVNSQDQAGRDYAQGLGQAGQDELDALLGVGGEQNNLYQTIFGQLLGQPTEADPTVYNTPSSQGGSPSSPLAQVHAAIGTSKPATVHDEGPAAYAQMHAIGKPTLPKAPKAPAKPKISTTLGRF